MMDVQYQIDGEIVAIQIESNAEGYSIALGDHIYDVQLNLQRGTELTFTVGGTQHTAYVVNDGSMSYVAVAGFVVELKKPDLRRASRKHRPDENNLSASMPGQVAKLLVNEGDVVDRGQTLLILEAMKMEIKIAAPHDGRVARVAIEPGPAVIRGQELIGMTCKH